MVQSYFEEIIVVERIGTSEVRQSFYLNVTVVPPESFHGILVTDILLAFKLKNFNIKDWMYEVIEPD